MTENNVTLVANVRYLFLIRCSQVKALTSPGTGSKVSTGSLCWYAAGDLAYRKSRRGRNSDATRFPRKSQAPRKNDLGQNPS